MTQRDVVLDKARELALGRILRMASRSPQQGDVVEYFRCRAIIMTDAPEFVDTRPNWAAQRHGSVMRGET